MQLIQKEGYAIPGLVVWEISTSQWSLGYSWEPPGDHSMPWTNHWSPDLIGPWQRPGIDNFKSSPRSYLWGILSSETTLKTINWIKLWWLPTVFMWHLSFCALESLNDPAPDLSPTLSPSLATLAVLFILSLHLTLPQRQTSTGAVPSASCVFPLF
jgi:hypothetical protein